MNKKTRNILLSVLLLAIAVTSFIFLAKFLSDVNTYKSIVEIIDDKKGDVLGLSVATSTASIAISAIPGDIGAPLADQLADISGYLLIILTVLYLEKYALTIIGFAFSRAVVPAVCLMIGLYIWNPMKTTLRKLAVKIGLFGICLLLLVPTSVGLTKMVDDTFEDSMAAIMTQVEEKIDVDVNDGSKEETSIFGKIANGITKAVDTISSATSSLVEKAKQKVSYFIEATAVMIVTACIIPLLTAMAFIWLANTLLNADIDSKAITELKDKVSGGIKGVSSSIKNGSTKQLETENAIVAQQE